MKLTEETLWNELVESNKDGEGKAIIDVAREVMKILDKGDDFDINKIIQLSSANAKTGGVTSLQAEAVVYAVRDCHERGEEFRLKWNRNSQIEQERMT